MHPHVKRLLPIAFAALALALATRTPALSDATSSQQGCGSVDLASASSSVAAKAFDCFSTAFAKCSPATLVATGQAAGAATTWTFATVDGGDDHGCSISETLERGAGASKTTDAYLCRALSRDKDALFVRGCGTQKDVALRVAGRLGVTSGR
ncbi:MAG: hypothetical protein M3Z41_09910 [Candidatus Eremiobacteraeota bacterium]|nr:hypothetical protein [Candidatus Eremiobacteraeota bacterium]